MKKICLPGLLSLFLLATTGMVFSQEYTNEGMPIRDADGNAHRIIMTKSGVWMAENLKTLKFNDGTPIPYGVSLL